MVECTSCLLTLSLPALLAHAAQQAASNRLTARFTVRRSALVSASPPSPHCTPLAARNAPASDGSLPAAKPESPARSSGELVLVMLLGVCWLVHSRVSRDVLCMATLPDCHVMPKPLPGSPCLPGASEDDGIAELAAAQCCTVVWDKGAPSWSQRAKATLCFWRRSGAAAAGRCSFGWRNCHAALAASRHAGVPTSSTVQRTAAQRFPCSPAPCRSSGAAPTAEKDNLQDTLRKLTKHVRRQARSKSGFRMVTCTSVGAEGWQGHVPARVWRQGGQ